MFVDRYDFYQRIFFLNLYKFFYMKYLFHFFLLILLCSCSQIPSSVDDRSEKNTNLDSIFVDFIVNPKIDKISFFWKNDQGEVFGNAKALKSNLVSIGSELVFATNGGMYLKDQTPQGLYIDNNEVKSKLDTIQLAYGNFYMQPNGVFYINNENEAKICKSSSFRIADNIKYATQSGPMLIIDKELHPKFKKESKSKFVRNGVGILPNGNILLVMSKGVINFYDFANYFKDKGCRNALYLDGFVSRTYLPSKKWIQEDGAFGVIIGVTTR
jgi:uncharacterized protein YigE (DUF2233 family)